MANSGKSPPVIPGQLAAWAVLIGLTVMLTALLTNLSVPAAPLLGAIAAAVSLAVYGIRIKVKEILFSGSQCLMGCTIAASISIATLHDMLDNPALILTAVFSVIIFSVGLGWFITIKQILPGTTGIWGISPGAATAMTLMSEHFGGDIRLVALMQYLRLVMVAAIASLVAGCLGFTAQAGTGWLESAFQPIRWQAFAQTAALALACLILARRIRSPIAYIMLPLLIGALLKNTGLIAISLPSWLMLVAYTLIGWNIGLRFTKPSFLYAMHVLPQIFASILLLIAMSAGIGVLLHIGANIDPLTAYLATSPGGVDSIAIIAVASGADMGFVMAIQTARLILVILLEPPLARLAAAQAQKRLK